MTINPPLPSSSRLRIGVVSAFPPGKNSLNEFGWHFVSSLASKPEVESVVLYADETDQGPPTPVDKVDAVPTWRFNSWFNLVRLVKSIRATRPDAVIFNLQFATFGDQRIPGGLGLLTPALTRAIGIPTAVVLHNLVESVDMQDAGFASNKLIAKLMTQAGRLLTKALLRADYVALTIPRYVELLQRSYRAENVLLAPHGAFETLTEPTFTSPSSPQRLLAFGKWGTYKSVEVLIEAYRLLLARGYQNVEVVVAGTDSPNSPGYLAGVAKQCGDLPGVQFTGYVHEADVAQLFMSAATTVFPYSSTTGSSGVLHQAGSYGRSAVLPNIGDFVDVIEEEGFTGQYFEPDNPVSLADAIGVLLDDPALREKMGRTNFAAATGIPISEVLDWHLFHLEPFIADARNRRAEKRAKECSSI